jgi:hypothetical protein
MVDQSISMNVNDTLELDYLVEEVSDSVVSFNKNPNGKSDTYVSRNSYIFDPNGTGTYEFELNGQIIEVEVTDIPDSGLSHYYNAKQESGTSTFTDLEGSKDLSAGGSPTLETGINNHQTMRYDGSDDEHTDSSPMALGTDDAYTVGMVFELVDTNTSSQRTIFKNGDSGENDGVQFFEANSDDWQHNHDGSTVVGDWGALDTNPHIFVATYDGTTSIVDFDKTEVLNANVGLNPLSDQFSLASLGGSGYINIRVGEFTHYTEFKNDTERNGLTDYFASEWDITV